MKITDVTESEKDGVFAMKALKEEIPELILLDIMLPGEDGLEILHASRHRK